jgi:ATP-binding cassette subfamily B protein
MQDVFLFSDTIEGNIAYGVPDIEQEAVLSAARTAAADSFIRKMTDGYDTIIGERGVGLSGGQRQRIALARALVIRPRILILDDTTSAVDMETEHEIQQALASDLTGSTVFIIAHRISSVRNADQIIVLDEGSIVERGTHEELLALRGIYFDVFATQAGLTAEETAALSLEGGAAADGTQPL